MADQFGYNQQFTDKPGMWDIDGYAVCVDGDGTLQVQVNRVSTTGVLQAVLQTAPSSAIESITQTSNNSGVYHIFLHQTWVELDMAHVEVTIPSSLSPEFLLAPIQQNTVGNVLYGPGLGTKQSVQFATILPSTLALTSIPQGGGIFFHLRLQNVST